MSSKSLLIPQVFTLIQLTPCKPQPRLHFSKSPPVLIHPRHLHFGDQIPVHGPTNARERDLLLSRQQSRNTVHFCWTWKCRHPVEFILIFPKFLSDSVPGFMSTKVLSHIALNRRHLSRLVDLSL